MADSGGQLTITFTEDPAPATSFSPDDIKRSILNFMADGHSQAEALMSEPHEQWAIDRRLHAGKWTLDQSTESVWLNRHYVPLLAEMIDFANSSEAQQLMPDPQAMDFVSVAALWPGLEHDAECSQALLRQKLRIMRTEDAPNFYEAVLALKQDRRVCGNAVAVVLHDFFSGDLDGDEATEGPVLQRVSPLNWFPWSRQCGTAAGCAHTIYAPLAEEEAERAEHFDVEALREAVKPSAFERAERALQTGEDLDGGSSSGPSDSGWRRFVYFGPLPWRKLGEDLKAEGGWTREAAVEALRGVFGFTQSDRTWWVGEWVDEYLISFRPYGLDLPAGLGPVLHTSFHSENDELLGLGVYDKLSWLERQYNELNRHLMLLSGWAANPPAVINGHLLNEDWKAEAEARPSFLLPGERIYLKDGLTLTAGTPDPIKILEMGIPQAMELVGREMARLEARMREGAQASGDYTGTSQARTATQAMNNLSQNKTMESHYVKLAENGWFLEIVQRCYVVLRQVIRLRGESPAIPAGFDEQQLRVLSVSPEAVRSLACFMITVDGSTAPSNKVYQTQQLEQLFPQIVGAMSNPAVSQSLQADVQWLYRAILDSLGIRGKHKAFLTPDDAQKMLVNLMAATGQANPALLPQQNPMASQAMMQTPMQPQMQDAMGGMNQFPGVAPLTPPSPPPMPAPGGMI